MMNSSLGDLDGAENYYKYNNDSESFVYKVRIKSGAEWIICLTITLITCCFGLVGNGYIIWLLGFQIKRNSFTTFILNLAVTDFGFVASQFLYNMMFTFTDFQGNNIVPICVFVIQMMYVNANFLMTAISIDRCVAVIFPIWHRCSRPKRLSSIVCAFLWISSLLLSGSMNLMHLYNNYSLLNFHFIMSAIVCLPLITLSTVVLFIKVCLKSNQRNQGRLLLMILITLLCFIILAFPLSVLAMIITFSGILVQIKLEHWIWHGVLLSCLNSSINPVIYFLVGRKKGARSKESMKVILQNVFKEGEETGGR